MTDRPFSVNLVLDWDQHERLEICAEGRVPIVSTFWGDPAPYVERIHAADAVHIHTVGAVAEARAAAAAGSMLSSLRASRPAAMYGARHRPRRWSRRSSTRSVPPR